ncbi:MAG: DUF1565 domain-containing protein [Thermoanaerobaculia bacterium]|nr:DUF1565 domain-containing protein [Thermoanaerobaculia bacterium]
MRYRHFVLAASFLVAAALPTFAADFHVATTGSDTTGTGSAAAPWATINHALASVPAGSTILVAPGTYNGRVRLDDGPSPLVLRSEVPYQARLRNTDVVVTCYTCRSVTLEGFDIAHSGPGAGALVIQIQDLIGSPGGEMAVSFVTLRNNVIHDSWNNDLVKINNGARDITVEGNLFYNQSGSDEHIDINSVEGVIVRENVFFNDFAGSGRPVGNDTSSYVVIKDSNGTDDSYLGAENITVERNIFLHWEGSSGSNFLLVGEDGQPYFEAHGVAIHSNLFLGDSANTMRAVFGVKGGQGIDFHYNTVVGDLPALAFAFRFNTEGDNPPNDILHLVGNVWSDPTGTMGAGGGGGNDFSDTPPGQTTSLWTLSRNLYWNGGAAIPADAGELINYTADTLRLVADPLLPSLAGVVPPRWDAGTGLFADGSRTIRQVFLNLARYGQPAAGSPARGAGEWSFAPPLDLRGYRRIGTSVPSLGASEAVVVFADDFERGHLDAWSTVVP